MSTHRWALLFETADELSWLTPIRRDDLPRGWTHTSAFHQPQHHWMAEGIDESLRWHAAALSRYPGARITLLRGDLVPLAALGERWDAKRRRRVPEHREA
jgi:hypothetical protein